MIKHREQRLLRHNNKKGPLAPFTSSKIPTIFADVKWYKTFCIKVLVNPCGIR